MLTSISSADDPSFLAQRVMIMHRYLPALAFGNIFISVTFYFLLKDLVAQYLLNWVLLGNVVMTAIFIAYDHRSMRKPWIREAAQVLDDEQRRFIHWAHIRYIVTMAMIGCVWGSTSLLFIDSLSSDFLNLSLHAVPTAVFVILMVTVSGLSIALGIVPSVFISFALPIMLPMTGILLWHPDPNYNWMGSGTLICLFTAIFLARIAHQNMQNMLKLQHQNSVLLKDLKVQTRASEKANTDKSRFLAAASHDLRQPLHTVSLFLGILQAESASEKQQGTLDNLQQAVDALSELLNSLLDISRLDAGNVSVHARYFPLQEALDKLDNEFALAASAKSLLLCIDDSDAVVFSDPILLQRILRNLLSNALIHTGGDTAKQTKVHVFVEVCEAQVFIHIKDTGPGIPDNEKENIYSEFHQLKNPERDRNKGLGLGLAIVKRLSNLLNHPLALRSNPGEGCCFSLQLPSGSHDQITPLSSDEVDKPDNPIAGSHILVVDDEPGILKAMQALIEQWDCHFSAAHSVQEALEQVQSGMHPDVLISDYRLPGEQTGLDCIQQIRAVLKRDIPALLISGDTAPEVLKTIRTSGLELLHKPVKPAQLRIAITRISR